MERPKFWILRNVQFRHICGGISFWSNFGRPKIWVFPCWVTTLDGCHWPQLTNSGRQFQQWSLFTFKQYCLKGILAKESSPRTKDFPLWSDLQGDPQAVLDDEFSGHTSIYLLFQVAWSLSSTNVLCPVQFYLTCQAHCVLTKWKNSIYILYKKIVPRTTFNPFVHVICQSFTSNLCWCCRVQFLNLISGTPPFFELRNFV